MSPSNQLPVVEIVKWLYTRALQAWPFLVAQGLVLLFLIWQWIELEFERRGCREWAGKGSSRRNSLLVEQLKLYITINESTKNGKRGASMADFSDRIDSLLEGIAGRLHNTINLFVIVGISGTFFGMGWFAQHLSSTNPSEVNRLLQQAMAQSFPIGFIGLLLTLIFHPIISLREQALREAATDAVNRALVMNSQVPAANDWDAVLKLLGDLPPKIGEIIEHNQEVLVARFIEATDKSIQPLKELFAESRSEWNETVVKLDKQSKRVSTAVDELTDGVRELRQPITSLTDSISQVKDTVSAMQALAVGVAQETQKAAVALQGLQIGILATSESLKGAADELEKLPSVASTNLKESFSEIVKASGAAYQDFGERYTSSIAQIAYSAIGNISGAAQTAGNTLTAASQELMNAVVTFNPGLTTAITQGAETLRRPMVEFDSTFREHFPDALDNLAKTLEKLTPQMNQGATVAERIAKAGEQTANAAEAWKSLQVNLVGVTNALKPIATVFEQTAGRWEVITQAQFEAAKSLQQTLKELRTVTNKRKRRGGLLGWLTGAGSDEAE
jgi:ABC-type transporter Mla subunit MlaD